LDKIWANLIRFGQNWGEVCAKSKHPISYGYARVDRSFILQWLLFICT